jgi:hypothetical protein
MISVFLDKRVVQAKLVHCSVGLKLAAMNLCRVASVYRGVPALGYVSVDGQSVVAGAYATADHFFQFCCGTFLHSLSATLLFIFPNVIERAHDGNGAQR